MEPKENKRKVMVRNRREGKTLNTVKKAIRILTSEEKGQDVLFVVPTASIKNNAIIPTFEYEARKLDLIYDYRKTAQAIIIFGVISDGKKVAFDQPRALYIKSGNVDTNKFRDCYKIYDEFAATEDYDLISMTGTFVEYGKELDF